jgi:hypothetical protein
VRARAQTKATPHSPSQHQSEDKRTLNAPLRIQVGALKYGVGPRLTGRWSTHLDLAINEFRDMKMQPPLGRESDRSRCWDALDDVRSAIRFRLE